MSLHIAMVSIEGAHADAAPEIFDLLDYKIVGTPAQIQSADALQTHLERNAADGGKVKRVVYADGGWTHIADFDLILFDEQLLWKELSKRWNTRVVCWICEGTSGTYAFALYENGELLRHVMSSDGKVSHVVGDALPEEDGLEWDEACEDDVFVLIEHFGIHYDDFETDRAYWVYGLDEL